MSNIYYAHSVLQFASFRPNNSIATRPKTATAAHLSGDSSKTKTISRFFRAYSSEGVSTLHVNSEVGVPKPIG